MTFLLGNDDLVVAINSSIPQNLWDATMKMPSATRHAIRDVFSQYDDLLSENARLRERVKELEES